MARQTHTAATVQGRYPVTATRLSFLKANVADKEDVVLTGQEVLFVWNTSGATAYTVTVTSVADQPQGRTGTITAESIPLGVRRIFGPFGLDGWRQTDGKLYWEGSNAALRFAVAKMPVG